LITSCPATDEEHARSGGRPSLFELCLSYGIAGGKPIGRQLIFRIGKSGARAPRDWTLSRVAVTVPSNIRQLLDLLLVRPKGWIEKLLAKPPVELSSSQLHVALTLADAWSAAVTGGCCFHDAMTVCALPE
jgi:hypothetical protein